MEPRRPPTTAPRWLPAGRVASPRWERGTGRDGTRRVDPGERAGACALTPLTRAGACALTPPTPESVPGVPVAELARPPPPPFCSFRFVLFCFALLPHLSFAPSLPAHGVPAPGFHPTRPPGPSPRRHLLWVLASQTRPGPPTPPWWLHLAAGENEPLLYLQPRFALCSRQVFFPDLKLTAIKFCL